MKNLKQIERLRKVHELILSGNTGSPAVIADNLGISERQFYNVLDCLKEMEAPIAYDRKTCTYYYTCDFDLLVNVSVQVMVQDELRHIYAGFTTLSRHFIYNDLIKI